MIDFVDRHSHRVFLATHAWYVQEGNVIMQPDGEVDIPVRRPDGDVELKGAGDHFYFPPCSNCGGVLKPNVVFFGDTIPKARALRHVCCVARWQASLNP